MMDRTSLWKRAYFQERLRNRLYELVIDEFIKRQELEPSFTQARLAKRIGRTPDQICRWLSSPGNWTSDTVSDLLLGIRGGELSIDVAPLSDDTKRNFTKPEWLWAIPVAADRLLLEVLVPNANVTMATVFNRRQRLTFKLMKAPR